MSTAPALEMRGISKRFGATLALDGVDFTLAPGEIHALLGENGAGKSTLMNILRGLLTPTAGQIRLADQPVTFGSPDDAARAGIGMVHQHFLLVPPFTVAENLALAARSGRGAFRLDTRPLAARATATAERLGWRLPVDATTGDLPVGTQQRVEIVKALLGDARILLFDEPTAVLAPTEIGELFAVLRALRDEGRSLVFVSHKLGEVMALCDRVTVLRRGRVVGTVAVADTGPEDLARRMVGGEALTPGPSPKNGRGEEGIAPDGAPSVPPLPGLGEGPGVRVVAFLSVQHLSTAAAPDAIALHDLSFDVRPGEILGFAGVDGNGQAELAAVLSGLRPWTEGTVTIGGTTLSRLRPRDLERYGVAVIPPDRHREGLALTLSVAENLMLEAARLPRFRGGPFSAFSRRRALRAFAADAARDFDIRADNLSVPASALSGGNQQKIVIARALWREPALLVAAGPTRGLDVAATAYVHAKLRERQAAGGAVILISTELDEVIALSTRIAVLYEGRIMGIVPPDSPRETLGLLMGGKTGVGTS